MSARLRFAALLCAGLLLPSAARTEAPAPPAGDRPIAKIPPPAAAAGPHEDLSPADRIRLAEAARLMKAVQEMAWPGWEAAPRSLLLVGQDREFLFGTDEPPPGFEMDAPDSVWTGPVFSRARTFPPTLLATFPAFGPSPTIVIGRAEATGKTSTAWVVTLLHEHFHQLQMSRSRYFEAVKGLDLAGEDQTGQWMLDYPFPYADEAIAKAYAAVASDLADAIENPSAKKRAKFWTEYRGFVGGLAEKDRRYLRFQTWQEGVARYVELRVADAAAKAFEPSPEVAALPDFEPYGALGARLREGILKDLKHPDLRAQKRVSFYSLGAGLAILLDQGGSTWKARYFGSWFLALDDES